MIQLRFRTARSTHVANPSGAAPSSKRTGKQHALSHVQRVKHQRLPRHAFSSVPSSTCFRPGSSRVQRLSSERAKTTPKTLFGVSTCEQHHTANKTHSFTNWQANRGTCNITHANTHHLCGFRPSMALMGTVRCDQGRKHEAGDGNDARELGHPAWLVSWLVGLSCSCLARLLWRRRRLGCRCRRSTPPTTQPKHAHKQTNNERRHKQQQRKTTDKNNKNKNNKNKKNKKQEEQEQEEEEGEKTKKQDTKASTTNRQTKHQQQRPTQKESIDQAQHRTATFRRGGGRDREVHETRGVTRTGEIVDCGGRGLMRLTRQRKSEWSMMRMMMMRWCV